MKNKRFRVTEVEALGANSVVNEGVEIARRKATELIARRFGGTVEDEVILSSIMLSGRLQLYELGAVAKVVEV